MPPGAISFAKICLLLSGLFIGRFSGMVFMPSEGLRRADMGRALAPVAATPTPPLGSGRLPSAGTEVSGPMRPSARAPNPFSASSNSSNVIGRFSNSLSSLRITSICAARESGKGEGGACFEGAEPHRFVELFGAIARGAAAEALKFSQLSPHGRQRLLGLAVGR